MPASLPSDMPRDRPGDFLRSTPGFRVSACVPAIPSPPEPWVSDVRRAAARLHVVPALVTQPETDGRHRPRGTWPAVALAVGLAGAVVLTGLLR